MASPSTARQLGPSVASSSPRLRFATTGGPQAPERTRAWLQSACSWLSAELTRPLQLLTCELVTNSVRHGGAGAGDLIAIELWPTDAGVGVQVTDRGPGFAPAGRDRELDDPGGWGLVLVEHMSHRWGVERDGVRTCVWFELAR